MIYVLIFVRASKGPSQPVAITAPRNIPVLDEVTHMLLVCMVIIIRNVACPFTILCILSTIDLPLYYSTRCSDEWSVSNRRIPSAIA